MHGENLKLNCVSVFGFQLDILYKTHSAVRIRTKPFRNFSTACFK